MSSRESWASRREAGSPTSWLWLTAIPAEKPFQDSGLLCTTPGTATFPSRRNLEAVS